MTKDPNIVGSDVNSRLYWERRFSEDWEVSSGREQSRFFSRLALKLLPSWLTRKIVDDRLSICDWGCAQGDGTHELAAALPGARVTGVDFSAAAVERANEAYPTCRFVCEDFLSSGSDSRFDVVFSSNTLEHFQEPWRVLERLATRSTALLVLLLPFQEYERIEEHFSTFDFSNIPVGFRGWTIVHSVVADATTLEPSYWNGKQILLVYARPDAVESLGLTLSDTTVHTADSEIEILKQLQSVIAERDSLQAELHAAKESRYAAEAEASRALAGREQALAERELALATLESMRASLSWKTTGPIRFALRLARHGLLAGDTQKLHRAARGFAGRLPPPARQVLRVSYNTLVKSPLRALGRRASTVRSFTPPTLKPAARRENERDYIVWGVIDWHFRHQRPQQLAQAIARSGRRVFYVSAHLVDDDRAGFEVEALDADGMLFQVRLFVRGAPIIYTTAPDADTVRRLRRSIGEVLDWADAYPVISIVQHPFWHPAATAVPNSRCVYDCMDHHEGFGNTAIDILGLEHALFRDADLTVTTSEWLDQSVATHTLRRALIRNAGDFDHFSRAPAGVRQDAEGRRIIGYYGAIAEWFDQDMVEAVARRYPDCCVLLVGADTVNARARLGRLPNVRFTGEVPYAELPQYLHAFDVCLLPFKVIPLTLATNPVKVYEYLSAGKPVVSVDLPEIRQFGELVRTGADIESFVTEVGNALAQQADPLAIQRRQRFAREQTWTHRAESLVACVEALPNEATASVIVVTYNNLALTRACLDSLQRLTGFEPIEIIVVDNASSDETPAFLSDWVKAGPGRKIILNPDNRGFAAANNQGLAAASGEYLVLLNNDTFVTPGWLRTLIRHMRRDPGIGLLGPVTNNIGNEAKIEISYKHTHEIARVSAAYTRRRIGETFPLRTAAFFCVMMSRAIYERVGPLDETFGRGFFEDDDYCRRVEQIGASIMCAEDVFIHHHLSASFNKLRSAERQALFEQNKAIYEAKWGKWVAHDYRKDRAS